MDPVRAGACGHDWELHSNWTKAKETDPGSPVLVLPRSDLRVLHQRRPRASQSIAEVGEDNICFETDYPHTDTTWPFSGEEAARMTASLTDEQRYKVLRGNAIRMLDLDRV